MALLVREVASQNSGPGVDDTLCNKAFCFSGRSALALPLSISASETAGRRQLLDSAVRVGDGVGQGPEAR